MQVISYSNGEPGIGSPEFRKRVGFSLSMPSSNLSIYINNTQESDSGRYLCNVIIPGAAGLSGEMRLNVKGTNRTGHLDSGTFQKCFLGQASEMETEKCKLYSLYICTGLSL